MSPSWQLAVSLGLACATALGAGPPAGAFASGRYRNLFHDYLGKTEAETDAKLRQGWEQLVAGDPATQRLIYSLDDGSAAVPDTLNHDVRTEGLSYGMMIALQMDKQDVFNRLWQFAQTHMRHATGPFRGYFAWHTTFEGRPLDPGPAPDGEEWFTMALFFASHRWGDGRGIFNYGAQAQEILHAMLHKREDGELGVTDMFDPDTHEVVFAPQGAGAGFTDPSYHLPAFYELWSRWADRPADRAFLAQAARASRALFRRAAHPLTGLMPDYTRFDGTPVLQRGHEDFRYDAWRTLSNSALDYDWWAADHWEVEEADRVLAFLARQGPQCPDLYQIDGTAITAQANSPGLVAMAGAAALAADSTLGRPAVERLWSLRLPEGPARYYGGLLTMLAWLEVGGRFRIYRLPLSRPPSAEGAVGSEAPIR